MQKFHQMITFNETAVFYKNGVLTKTDTSPTATRRVRGEAMLFRTTCYTIDPNDDMAVNMTFPTNFTDIADGTLTAV